MPFKSEKQRRFLWANEPELAEKWTKEYGSKAVESLKKAAPKKAKHAKHGKGD